MKKIFLAVLPIAVILLLFLLSNKVQNGKETLSQSEKNNSASKQEAIRVPNTASNIIVAVGDIMLSRHVGEKIRQANDPRAPFLKTVNILKAADITFANLESPFYDQGPSIKEGMVFKAEPNTIEGLLYASFDIVSLANNHFGDRGVAGMNFTFQHLTDSKIQYVGAGENLTKARETKIIERNGIKFAFLGYDDIASTITPQSYTATDTKSGLAPLKEEWLKADIKNAKEKADVVVVSFHWGTEYQQTPNERQKNVGRLAIDSGASLVLGHHPHVIQPYEKYKDGYIFYSLGNFVFDQMWSEATRKGEIAKIYFKGLKIEKAEILPIKIYDYYQPRTD